MRKKESTSMKVEASSIEELIEKSGDQKGTLIYVDEFMQKTAPNLIRKLYSGPSITMIGYGEMDWETKSKSGVWPLICLAPQKGTTNLYVAGKKNDLPLLKVYGNKLGKVSMGKSCLRVKKVDNVNWDELKNLIQDAITWMEKEKNEYGRDCARPVE